MGLTDKDIEDTMMNRRMSNSMKEVASLEERIHLSKTKGVLAAVGYDLFDQDFLLSELGKLNEVFPKVAMLAKTLLGVNTIRVCPACQKKIMDSAKDAKSWFSKLLGKANITEETIIDVMVERVDESVVEYLNYNFVKLSSEEQKQFLEFLESFLKNPKTFNRYYAN